jgi:integrase/recombinase XerD
MDSVTSAVRLGRRLKKGTNTFPVVIRVTYQRIPNYFGTPISMTPEDFRKLSSPRLGDKLICIKKKLEQEHDRVKEIIGSIHPFSMTEFRRRFYSVTQDIKNIPNKSLAGVGTRKLNSCVRASGSAGLSEIDQYKAGLRHNNRKYARVRSDIDFLQWGELAGIFGRYINKLIGENRIGTSEMYFVSLISLLEFHRDLRLKDINISFLIKYEEWMIAKGNSCTTVGMYLRNLRAICNLCIEEGLMVNAMYPFGRRKYQIPSGVNTKKALDLSTIKLLYDHQPQTSNPDELIARDLWFFMFFGNGMNPRDLAMLKFKNLEGEYIRFIRQKTKNTTRSRQQMITVYMNDDMRSAIHKWGNPHQDPNNYLFPILRHEISPYGERELLQAFIKKMNKWMKVICLSESISTKVRCMEARHSFSTVLKRSGASPEFIRESLGHMDLKTTNNYLDSFEDDVKKEYSLKLLDFKNLDVAVKPASSISGQMVTIETKLKAI